MNKHLIPAAALSASVLGLAACGANVQHGVIIDKSFTPGYFAHYQRASYGQKCTTSSGIVKRGKVYVLVTSRSCRNVLLGYSHYTSYIPAVYALELRDSKGNKGWVDVTSSEYNSVHDGMNW